MINAISIRFLKLYDELIKPQNRLNLIILGIGLSILGSTLVVGLSHRGFISAWFLKLEWKLIRWRERNIKQTPDKQIQPTITDPIFSKKPISTDKLPEVNFKLFPPMQAGSKGVLYIDSLQVIAHPAWHPKGVSGPVKIETNPSTILKDKAAGSYIVQLNETNQSMFDYKISYVNKNGTIISQYVILQIKNDKDRWLDGEMNSYTTLEECLKQNPHLSKPVEFDPVIKKQILNLVEKNHQELVEANKERVKVMILDQKNVNGLFGACSVIISSENVFTGCHALRALKSFLKKEGFLTELNNESLKVQWIGSKNDTIILNDSSSPLLKQRIDSMLEYNSQFIGYEYKTRKIREWDMETFLEGNQVDLKECEKLAQLLCDKLKAKKLNAQVSTKTHPDGYLSTVISIS